MYVFPLLAGPTKTGSAALAAAAPNVEKPTDRAATAAPVLASRDRAPLCR